VIAHRGRSSLAGPENTVVGALAALADGCDGVEVDVRRTRDGALVLVHDPTPLRTTFARDAAGEAVRRRPVEASRLEELRSLGLRNPGGGRHPEWQVPLLRDVLRPALWRGAVVVLDVKDVHPSEPIWASLTEELALLPAGWRHRTVVQSRNDEALRRIQRELPGLSTSLMTWGTVRSTLVEGGFSMTSRPWRTTSASTIAREHAHGRRVLAWTVNQTHRMLQLLDRGVDGIITDEPLLLLDLVEGLESSAGCAQGAV